MADSVNVCRFGPGFLPRLLDHLRTELPDSCGAGMSVLSTGAPPRVASANGSAEVLDELQWHLREGPLLEAQQTEQVVRATPLLDETKWPRFSEAAKEAAPGVTAGLFVPGTWDQAGPVLLSVYLSSPPDADTLRQVERLEPLLATALGMAEFCAGENLRAESMLIMMQYRRVIEQAKGAIMVTLGCNADTAFETLVRSSQHFGVRLRELSVAVAERVSGGPSDVPSDGDHELVITDRDREAADQMWSAIAHRGVLPMSLRRGKPPTKAAAKASAKAPSKAAAKKSPAKAAKKSGAAKSGAKTAAKAVGKHTTKAPAKSAAAKSPAGATATTSEDLEPAQTGA